MARNIDLNKKGRGIQSQFAQLVGISQPAVFEKIKAGVLSDDGTLGDWLIQYTEQLRKEAAGRSGKAQEELTHARIDESRENAAAKRQSRLRDAGELILLSDVQTMCIELPVVARSQLVVAGENIKEGIESKYSIELEEDDVDKHIQSALRHVANTALKLCETYGTDGRGVSSEADRADAAMG